MSKLEHVFESERLDELRARGIASTRESSPDALDQARAQIGDDDLFTFIYTSGTTGPPKACMILNRNYYDMVGRIDEIESLLPPDRRHAPVPAARAQLRAAHAPARSAPRIHDRVPARPAAASARSCPKCGRRSSRPCRACSRRCTRRCPPTSRPPRGVKRRLIDWALGVGREVSELRQRREPVAGGLALKHRLADRLVYSKVKERLGGRLRAAISGGAPLAKEIAEFFHVLDILILEGYGQTEETSAATVNRPERTSSSAPSGPRSRVSSSRRPRTARS